MCDYDRECDKPRVIRHYGSTTSAGKLKPYNELLRQRETVGLAFAADEDRDTLRRLAWYLGSIGETHACEALMEHLAIVERRKRVMTPFGWM